MHNETIDLYEYFGLKRDPGARGYLTVFMSEIDEIGARIRPSIVICPGGGYKFWSKREGEPVAIRFMGLGYAAFLLDYSINTKFPTPLIEAAMAVAYVKEHTEKYKLSGQVAAIGFSAGGHLAGMLATLFDTEEVVDALGKHAANARPDAVVLSYAVITTSIHTHGGTASVISGGDPKLAARLSVENRVNEKSVPAFIWHTGEDDAVPVENALLLASAYRKVGVPFELHIFEKGWHGLSLISPETCDMTEKDRAIAHVGRWMELAAAWLTSRGFVVKFEKR